MLPVKIGLRARAFADKYVVLREIEASEILLLRSSNEVQTNRVIEQLRKCLPRAQVVLVVQKDFVGKFAVDEEIIYPLSGFFKLNSDTEQFFSEIALRNFPLVLIMYHDFPRRNYEETEKCALACGGKLTAGVFPDGLIIEVTEDISRKRGLSKKLHQQLLKKIELENAS